MAETDKNEIHSHGLRVFKPRHRLVRELKHCHSPAVFGYRVWKSSWLLIDFIKSRGLPDGLNILDVGCGWGLAGIYCAKNHNAAVTCLDVDSKVFPFLHLHAETNQVDIATRIMRIEDLEAVDLEKIDVIIAADVCFWDEMVAPWLNLIHRARKAGVRLILIADPGRAPFGALEEDYLKDCDGSALTWEISRPYDFRGWILKIGDPFQNSGRFVSL